jgi:uncharacterized membrane protein YfcA
VLDPPSLALLALVGLLTAVMSVMAGIGGGAVLIAVLLMFFAPAQAIPFHGMVQLVGNISRIVILRRHIAWRIVWRVAVLVPLGAALGLWLFQGLPPRVIEMAIGLFVLLSLFDSARFPFFKERDMPLWGFFPVGFLLGAAAVTVAVVAMFAAPFMIRKDLSCQGIIVTMGTLAGLGHIAKVVGFGVLGFHPVQFWQPFLVMMPAVVLGTVLGERLLRRMSEAAFRAVFRWLLAAVALKLILWDGLLEPLFRNAV